MNKVKDMREEWLRVRLSLGPCVRIAKAKPARFALAPGHMTTSQSRLYRDPQSSPM